MLAAAGAEAGARAVCDYDVWVVWHNLYSDLLLAYRLRGGRNPPKENAYPFPCVPIAGAPPAKRPTDAQYAAVPATAKPIEFFGAIEGGGGFYNTNFLTIPGFDVRSDGGLLGVNGGVLWNVGSAVAIGPRVGWIGSNINGKTERPLASPNFDYEVQARNAYYAEAFLRFGGFTPDNDSPRPQDRVYVNYNYYATASLGIAQMQNRVIGTSGAFRVVDNYTATGLTASVGLGMPIYQASNGLTIDLTGQYRTFFMPQVEVNIPGKVGIDFRGHSVLLGLQFRQMWAPPPPP